MDKGTYENEFKKKMENNELEKGKGPKLEAVLDNEIIGDL